MKARIWTGLLLALGMAGLSVRADDAFLGNYEGVLKADRSQTAKATAKVIAERPAYYRIVVQAEPLATGDTPAQFEIFGVRQGAKVNLFGRANALSWRGTLGDDQLTADPGYYGMGLELRKTTKKSPQSSPKHLRVRLCCCHFRPGRDQIHPPGKAAHGSRKKMAVCNAIRAKGRSRQRKSSAT